MTYDEKTLTEHSPFQFHNLSYEEGMFCVEILNNCHDFNGSNVPEEQKCEIAMINLKKQSRIGKEKIYVYSGAYKVNGTGENRTFNGTIFWKDEKIEVINLIERLCANSLEDTPKRYRTFDTFTHIEDNLYERKSSYNYTEKEIEPKKVYITKYEEKIIK